MISEKDFDRCIADHNLLYLVILYVTPPHFLRKTQNILFAVILFMKFSSYISVKLLSKKLFVKEILHLAIKPRVHKPLVR